jgi:hypothetical protein
VKLLRLIYDAHCSTLATPETSSPGGSLVGDRHINMLPRFAPGIGKCCPPASASQCPLFPRSLLTRCGHFRSGASHKRTDSRYVRHNMHVLRLPGSWLKPPLHVDGIYCCKQNTPNCSTLPTVAHATSSRRKPQVEKRNTCPYRHQHRIPPGDEPQFSARR